MLYAGLHGVSKSLVDINNSSLFLTLYNLFPNGVADLIVLIFDINVIPKIYISTSSNFRHEFLMYRIN